MAQKHEPKHPQGKKRRRWQRRVLALVSALAVLLLLPTIVLRSGLATSYVLSRVEHAIGADVSASRLTIGSDATVVAEGVTIRVPGIPGPAGDLFQAERIEIVGTWAALLRSSEQFDQVILTRPKLRISRDKHAATINLAALTLPTSDGGAVVVPPRVVVRGGVVELGEHDGDSFELLRSIPIEGSAQPAQGDDGGYELAFTEAEPPDAANTGLGLTGLITPDGVTLELNGLDLATWGPEHIPERFREVFALMRIEGGIPTASLRVEADGSTEGVIELNGVSMNLPFDAEGRPAGHNEMVRLRDVRGRVEIGDQSTTADLRGLLGDLPSTVHLRYDGLRADSPFRCVIETSGFALESNPEILPLAPEIVKRRLADFSNPTATVDATVTLQRDEPSVTGPGQIHVTGQLAFRDGSAAFEGFPYRFTQMSGLARFDEEKIEIVSVDGIAASGAKLHATGTIIPPHTASEVKIRVNVSNVPIDTALLQAMGEHRRKAVQALCHTASYDRLREMDLLCAPGEQGPGREFALGGVGSAVIDIHRPAGEASTYQERIEVRIPRLGLLPEPFPLPIVANDVRIVIADDKATISGGSFTGIDGGHATLDASVDLTKPGDTGLALRIEADDIPADSMLLAALPGGLDAEPDPRSPRGVLQRLGVHGSIDCTAIIQPRTTGKLGYDIHVAIDELSASPRHDETTPASALALDGLRGTLRVSEADLEIRVQGRVDSASIDGQSPRMPEGTLELAATMAFGDDARPFTADLQANLPDVRIAIEDLVSVVAPEMAERLHTLRLERRPEGGIRARILAAGDAAPEGTLNRLDVELRACDGLRFDADPGRFTVSSSEGLITLSALDFAGMRFDSWDASLSLDDDPPSEIQVSGRAPAGKVWAESDALSLNLRGMPINSALVRSMTSAILPEGVPAAIESAQLAGRFDADLHVAGRRDLDTPLISGAIRPERFELTLAGQRVTVEDVDGVITLDDAGGSFDTLRVAGNGWQADLRGRWDTARSGAVILETNIDGRSEQGLTTEVAALLPTGLREALESLAFETSGPLVAQGIAMQVSLNRGASSAHTATGRVVFEDAAADVGVRLSNASGYLDFESQSQTGTTLSNFGIGVVLDAGQAAGVRFEQGAMRITSDPLSMSVLVPAIRAEIHGGRLTGSAILSIGDATTYQAEFRASGVPLGELLADWEYTAGIQAAAGQDQSLPERPEAQSRGIVDAGLTLTGTLGQADARRGRGRVLVGGGQGARVMRLPLLLPLIEVSNLQVPRNDPLDFGEALFILDGDRLVFERLGVFAQSVEIFGYGQMTIPDLALDLRFSSRATARVPVLSRIIERLRDELVMTRVRGTVRQPRVTAEQFTRTKRMLAGVIGEGLTDAERRMLDIERQSREAERREWRSPRPTGSGDAWGR